MNVHVWPHTYKSVEGSLGWILKYNAKISKTGIYKVYTIYHSTSRVHFTLGGTLLKCTISRSMAVTCMGGFKLLH